jgi:hypothetical protein
LYGLTDEIPGAVHVAVRRGTHRPYISYPPTEVSEFDSGTFDLGQAEVEVAPNERVHAYDQARTVVDVMRMRHRLGEPIAFRALRQNLASPGSRPAELLNYARALDVEGPVRHAVEVVLS